MCNDFYDHDHEKIIENPNAHGAYQIKLLEKVNLYPKKEGKNG